MIISKKGMVIQFRAGEKAVPYLFFI